MSAAKDEHIDWMDECDRIAEESVRVENKVEETKERMREIEQREMFDDYDWNWSGLRQKKKLDIPKPL